MATKKLSAAIMALFFSTLVVSSLANAGISRPPLTRPGDGPGDDTQSGAGPEGEDPQKPQSGVAVIW